MQRSIAILLLLFALVWALRETFSGMPRGQRGNLVWAMLSGGMMVAGVWMIVADL